MDIHRFIILAAIILFIVTSIVAFRFGKRMDEKYAREFDSHPSKFIMRKKTDRIISAGVGIGMVLSIFGFFYIAISTLDQKLFWVLFTPFLIGALGFIIYLSWLLLWKITVDQDEISILIPFHKKKIIRFQDITHARDARRAQRTSRTGTMPLKAYYVFVPHKKAFLIDEFTIGFEYFISILKSMGKFEETD